MRARLVELAAVVVISSCLAIAMTWPLAARIGEVGRVDNADGQFAIWNVGWVARTLVVDPLHVFDANIFYPHKRTLAYSDANLGAGTLAIPAYWATGSAITAHNVVVLLGFVLTATSTYYLVGFLTCDRGAAAVSAICFTFTPFVFAHTSHIQLLMTAGLPLSMLMFHRLIEDVSPGRGAALGAAMVATALLCGYYGVFAILMIGYSVVIVAATRRWWLNRKYWVSLAVGAAVALVLITPVFLPYLSLQRETGFERSLSDARPFSANWSDYLASASNAHAWMLGYLPQWIDVSFPGFIASVFALAGAWIAYKRRRNELLAIYGGIAVLACWASFGPAGGLYSVLYGAVPLFTWLRAPSRFGIVVVFAIAVLAGVGVSAFLSRVANRRLIAVLVAIVAVVELRVSFVWRDVPPFDPVYHTLAAQPPGPVIELPFYYLRSMFPLHAAYMLSSTTHWMPIVNGYSDFFPQDFRNNVLTLAPFPTVPAMKLLEPGRVRYAVFHMGGYNNDNRRDVEARLMELNQYFRPLYVSDQTRLYEIVGYPP